MTTQGLINHIALVLDASYSMGHLTEAVVKAADEQITHLAKRSTEEDQETRVSVYTFDDDVKCVVSDKDVLRLPSVREIYRPDGNTALIDATLLAVDDLNLMPQKYGDHSFFVIILTDGEENRSRTPNKVAAIQRKLGNLPDNWTVWVLVPHQGAKRHAQQYGFPADNITIWDATSTQGVEEAARTIRTVTDNYMAMRKSGVRGTRSVLQTGAQINADAIKAAKLKPLPTEDRQIVVVTKTADSFEKVLKKATKTKPEEKGWVVEIAPFVNAAYPPYRVGRAYYELVKRERIQGDKSIAVVEVNTNKVFVGQGARDLLGLPDVVTSVKPDLNPNYKIYVQSSSLNRHLPIGTHVLLLTN